MSKAALAGLLCVLIATSVIVAISSEERSAREERLGMITTMQTLCRIAVAIEEFSIDHGQYPRANSVLTLEKHVVPRYIDRVPTSDNWGNEFYIDVTPARYTIASCGKGATGECTPAMVDQGGESGDPTSDIVLSGGVFHVWPAGVFNDLHGNRPGCRHLQDREYLLDDSRHEGGAL